MKKFIIPAVAAFTATIGAVVTLVIRGNRKHYKEEKKMSESKLQKANENIAESVVGSYKKIEDGVVGGYKKIEDGAVGGYKKIEDGVVGGYKKIEEGVVGGFNKMTDKFVDKFLTHEGESVEDAKKRLAVEQSAREQASKEAAEKRSAERKARMEASKNAGKH